MQLFITSMPQPWKIKISKLEIEEIYKMDSQTRRYNALLNAKKKAKDPEFKKIWQNKLTELLIADNTRRRKGDRIN